MIGRKFPTIDCEKIIAHEDVFSAINQINVKPKKTIAVVDTEINSNYKVAIYSIRALQPTVPIILYTSKLSHRCKNELNLISYDMIISHDTMPIKSNDNLHRLIMKRQAAVNFLIGSI